MRRRGEGAGVQAGRACDSGRGRASRCHGHKLACHVPACPVNNVSRVGQDSKHKANQEPSAHVPASPPIRARPGRYSSALRWQRDLLRGARQNSKATYFIYKTSRRPGAVIAKMAQQLTGSLLPVKSSPSCLLQGRIGSRDSSAQITEYLHCRSLPRHANWWLTEYNLHH